MKRTLFTVVIILLFNFIGTAQQPKGIFGVSNWMYNWTNFKPATTDYNEATDIITGVISKDTKLYKRNTYLLNGIVYVTNNAVLTIEPGTVIRGDQESCGTLVVTKGAKIIAEGNETDPIVFTSNKNTLARRPGDWGGIILLGQAPINKIGGMGYLDFNLNPAMSYYGGEDVGDSSGILKYVRIEYSGRKLNAHKELNGLSMAGVGRKTILDYIQISFSNDDSFECYGGDVNLNNLISYRTTDDDFDFTQGAQANLNNSIAIRHPYSSDISGSRCFEIDSYDKPNNVDFTKKMTKVNANNITLINMEENDQGLVRESIYIKEKSNLSLNNCVISGFSPFILLDEKIEYLSANLARISLNNITVNRCKGKIVSQAEEFNTEINNWYSNDAFAIEYTDIPKKDLFTDVSLRSTPDFRVKVNNLIGRN
ncbi:hypothetical protein LPBF_01810 [Flavobacterium crassostreae]|uniref:Uncharacterized protein n=2 Tax=Flavobacterium crassostreae TaxID=1763534 RepID=A0A1B9E9X4_9FLAO|nr:hypothetical protein [Flavobacterium crassostreae]OCB78754.1 hypothetical protein LPBF_01810 [Flavobacterium crassostreae]